MGGREALRNGGLPSRIGLNGQVAAWRTELRLPADLTVSAWARIGSQITLLSNSSAWWLGDWLVYGRDNFSGRYKQVMTETSLDYQTLRNYAWVAGRFDAQRRREALSFQHHAVVAALPEAEQDAWLDRAASDGWSLARFRAQVRAAAADPARPARGAPGSLHIDLSGGRRDQWEGAARQQNQDLAEWAVSILDDMAAGTLADASPTLSTAAGS